MKIRKEEFMTNFFKKIPQFISILLCITMLVSMVSTQLVLAQSSDKGTQKSNKVNADIGELPKNSPDHKIELKNKRTKYSKRFLNPDGSFTEQIYLEPQFFKNGDRLSKIKNKLRENKGDSSKVENTSNSFDVNFTKKINNGSLVSINKNKKTIEMIPQNANKVSGIIKNDSIRYKNAYTKTDLKYTVKGDGVKEDIIVKDYTRKNTYSFKLLLHGLNIKQLENGQIVVINQKGEKKWAFAKPYLIDADQDHSNKVKLKLRKEKGKSYIDVVVDKSYLKDPDTTYPVTIDPTLNTWNIMRDSFIASNFADTSYSSENFTHTGHTSYLGKTRNLMRFYLPTLPSDSKINSASVSAYQTESDGQEVSVDLYRTTEWWGPSVTWNSQPAIGSSKESTVTSNVANAYWSWDITDLATDWYNGNQANYGIMLKQQNESSSPYRTFNSVESGNNTPRLTINYRVDPIGSERFWRTTKDGVNPSNGNLTLNNTDIQIPGRGKNVQVTRTYNSRKSIVDGIFGYGWTSNIDRKLVDAGSGPITYIDEDGTRHVFGEKVSGGYESHDGIYLQLVKNGDATYTITKVDGTKYNFYTNGNLSSIVDTNGNRTSFNQNISGQITHIVDDSGRTTTLTYNADGYVSSVTDPANNTISYDYDVDGNLIKVTDAETNETKFGYDTSHNMTSKTDANQNTITYTYNANDRLKSVNRPITINDNKETSTITYSYDTTNGVTSRTDGENHRVDYSYNAHGNIVQITKDPLDSVNKAVTTYEYDNYNNLTKVTQPNENANGTSKAYIYQYDEKGNITSVQLPENEEKTYSYDSQGNQTQMTDPLGNTTNYSYDQNNNHMETTDPYKQSVATRYSDNGNLQYDTPPMSTANNLLLNSDFEYDNNDNWPGNWTKTPEQGTSATFSWSSTSKFGDKSVSVSHSSGYATIASDKVNIDSSQQYVASAFVKTENASSKAFIKVEYYDSSNNYLDQDFSYGITGTQDWTRLHLVADDIPTDATQIVVKVGLNAADSGTGYFDAVQLERGTVVSAYNIVQNSSLENDSDGDGIPNKWTTSGNLSSSDVLDDTNKYVGSNSFKINGETGVNKYITQHINISGDSSTDLTLSGWSKQENANPNGGNYEIKVRINNSDGTTDWSNANSFDKTKSGWQHVAAEVQPIKPFKSVDVYYYYGDQAGSAWFDAMRLEKGASHTSYFYDNNQNYVTEVKDPEGDSRFFSYDSVGNQTSKTDGNGNTTNYEYNANNQLDKVIDPYSNITTYGYDGEGNRTKVTDPKSNITTYSYNEYNKISKFNNPLNQETQFEYDKVGNVSKVIYENGDYVSYSYNDLNRLTNVSYNGNTKWIINYDHNGNVTSVTDANDDVKNFTYDKNNRLIQIGEGTSNSISYNYDENSAITSIDMTAGSATHEVGVKHNPLNQLISLSRDGANLANFTYDERGNISSIKHENGTYTAYTYNEANQLKSVKNYSSDGNVINSYVYSYDSNGNTTEVQTQNGTITYQYDELNQLVEETLTNGTTITYEYDSIGNRTKKIVDDGSTTETTTYAYDEANQLITVDGEAYTYDGNGNLTDNGNEKFTYNENNRLIEVRDSSGSTIARYKYDHQGRRVSKTTPAETINYYYDRNSNRVLYETDANNNIVAEYTYDNQKNPVTMTKNGTTYHYHINGHGDVTAMTDANGSIVAQYEYDAWGNITSQSGTMASNNPIRYAGYRYDNETGLYYLKARYYDADIGRFLTRDSFHGIENDPLSLNQYAYTKNNPVMYKDANGHLRKRINFGFNTYVYISTNWWSYIYISLNITTGGLIENGISLILGVGTGYFVQKFLLYVVKRSISNLIGVFAAKTAISGLTKLIYNSSGGVISSTYRWSRHSIFYYSHRFSI